MITKVSKEQFRPETVILNIVSWSMKRRLHNVEDILCFFQRMKYFDYCSILPTHYLLNTSTQNPQGLTYSEYGCGMPEVAGSTHFRSHSSEIETTFIFTASLLTKSCYFPTLKLSGVFRGLEMVEISMTERGSLTTQNIKDVEELFNIILMQRQSRVEKQDVICYAREVKGRVEVRNTAI